MHAAGAAALLVRTESVTVWLTVPSVPPLASVSVPSAPGRLKDAIYRNRRGHITKAGPEAVRTALVEAAWAYRYRPAIGATIRRRQAGQPPGTLARSWKAQQRLHAKYKKMTARGKPPGVAVVAVARELAGFVWAEMTS